MAVSNYKEQGVWPGGEPSFCFVFKWSLSGEGGAVGEESQAEESRGGSGAQTAPLPGSSGSETSLACGLARFSPSPPEPSEVHTSQPSRSRVGLSPKSSQAPLALRENHTENHPTLPLSDLTILTQGSSF